jgi:hypothetical protein
MAEGNSKAKIVKAVQDQVSTLAAQNKKCAEASKEYGTGRVWMLGPTEESGWDGDVTDLTGIKKAFDKSEIIDCFNEVMNDQNPGTVSDKIAMKFQSDYLAAMERAFRTRHAGSIRCELFASDRRFLQGSGNIEGQIIGNLQNVIARGQ